MLKLALSWVWTVFNLLELFLIRIDYGGFGWILVRCCRHRCYSHCHRHSLLIVRRSRAKVWSVEMWRVIWGKFFFDYL